MLSFLEIVFSPLNQYKFSTIQLIMLNFNFFIIFLD